MYILILVSTIISVTYSAPISSEKLEDSTGYYDPKAFYSLDRFEGDILGAYPTSNTTSKVSPYHAIVDGGYLWPNGELVYTIDSSLQSHASLIKQAMQHITSSTGGCIKFKERTFEPAYVYMYQAQGCYSQVGKQGGAQELSLGRGCHVAGVVIHELLHALGFYHHHSRSDRDRYLRINYQNIDPQAYPQFQKLNDWENQLFTDFDYGSIMIYGSTAFSRDGYSQTMTPTNPSGTTIQDPGYKYAMTSKDVEALKRLYKCSGSTGTGTGTGIGGIRGIWPHDETTTTPQPDEEDNEISDESDEESKLSTLPSWLITTPMSTTQGNLWTTESTDNNREVSTGLPSIPPIPSIIGEQSTPDFGLVTTETPLTLVTVPGSDKILTPPPQGGNLPDPELPGPVPPFQPSADSSHSSDNKKEMAQK